MGTSEKNEWYVAKTKRHIYDLLLDCDYPKVCDYEMDSEENLYKLNIETGELEESSINEMTQDASDF